MAPCRNVRFILVRPRNPNNIGAVARAMANFGLSDLAVADIHAPIWKEARSAVGADHVLRRIRAGSLKTTLKGCTLVLGTADERRKMRRPVIPLPGLADFLQEKMASSRARLAILFGSEKSGLRNIDLQHCHAVVSIPTIPKTPSMNLGQAAALIAYELSRAASPARMIHPREPMPTQEQLEDLVGRALPLFDRLDYMRGVPDDVKAEKLRRMLKRWKLLRQDAGLLQALLRRAATYASLFIQEESFGKKTVHMK